ncbi:hypothetical protein B0A55_06980 [Friedmanniomyces simplex]|uniref:Uncharacterized protein n=1 Tax=Friedmanniomyces simplex TaxID=329884 RepID=A0A4U0X1L3_9PEZI|nr:hypothetical protein B0A55_06980 [Friedmanniomyces simplex]
MHLSSATLALLSVLATTALAAPRPLLQAPTPHEYIAAGEKIAGSSKLVKRATGGVRLCTAGHTLSFQPDAGTECFLMQGRCNSEQVYADLQNDTPEDSDLSGLPWIGQSQSYLCLSPLG